MNTSMYKVEYWKQNGDFNAHVARCARVCYASNKKGNDDLLVDGLKKNNHISIFRHWSCYYIVSIKEPNFKSIRQKLTKFDECPYVKYIRDAEGIYLATNFQFILEHQVSFGFMRIFAVSEEYFFNNCPYDDLRRLTFYITTQISTSRELNRVSPNNIAEQSTRYVNFNKRNGITIQVPHWYIFAKKEWHKVLARIFWKIDEIAYNTFIKLGYNPQDAREFLPLSTETKCVYTYTLEEWRKILDLRYYGTTGAPHPNAMSIGSVIKQILENEGYKFRPYEYKK